MVNHDERVQPLGLVSQARFQANQKASQVGASVKKSVSDVGQRISQAPAKVAEKRTSIQRNVGAGSRRGGFSSTGTQKNPRNWSELKEEGKKIGVKGGPVLFWLVAGIALVKDIIDVFSTIIDFVGLGLSATVVGSVVGVPLTFFSEIIDFLSGLIIDFTIVAYFGFIGGGFALRLIITSIGALIDMVPFLNVLPMTTVTFFAAYLMGRAVKVATDSALVGAGIKGVAMAKGAANYAGKLAKYI